MARAILRVEPRILKTLLAKATFKNNGDTHERTLCELTASNFPRCELFWRNVVVPATERMEGYPHSLSDKILIRDSREFPTGLGNAFFRHYSLFLSLSYAQQHAASASDCDFEDFYAHVGSACDLSEDVLLDIYTTLLECRGEHVPTLTELTEEEFVKLARRWYGEEYAHVYELYKRKGRMPPIYLPEKLRVLDSWFGNDESWKEYKRLTMLVRTYRNVIVHNYQVGRIVQTDSDDVHVPKLEALKDESLSEWKPFLDAVFDEAKRREIFEPVDEHMASVVTRLTRVLNKLWAYVLQEFDDEFFHAERAALRKLYAIEFEPAPTARAPAAQGPEAAPATPTRLTRPALGAEASFSLGMCQSCGAQLQYEMTGGSLSPGWGSRARCPNGCGSEGSRIYR